MKIYNSFTFNNLNKNNNLLIQEHYQNFLSYFEKCKKNSSNDDLFMNFRKAIHYYGLAQDIYQNNKTVNNKKIFILMEENIKTLLNSRISSLSKEFIKDASHGSGKSQKYSLLKLSHISYILQEKIAKSAVNNKMFFSNYFNNYKTTINQTFFAKNITSVNDLSDFLSKKNKREIPFYLSLYLTTNLSYEKSPSVGISPEVTLKNKKGDCFEFALVSDYVLRKNGLESKIIGITYQNKKDGHAVCLYKDAGNEWDVLDVTGFWNSNSNNIIQLMKDLYQKNNNISRIYEVIINYDKNGAFENQLKEIDLLK